MSQSIPLHILQLDHVPILNQLQIEEALLRADQRNWCIINHGSSPSIVMGISGKPQELIHSQKMKQTPVVLIRRFSGGGTVFIDENTCLITFICNTSFIPISPFPEHIMRWTEQLYKPLFPSHAFALQENDYVLGHRKFGGNAQSICKNRWLHHSSLLWDYCPNNMDYLSIPKKIPVYRQQRSHAEFLCRLRDYWPQKSLFIEAFLRQIQSHFQTTKVKKEEIEDIIQLLHRKATTIVDFDERKDSFY